MTSTELKVLLKQTTLWKVKMIAQDVFMLISIFCDVDDFCKEFEAEWRKILIQDRSRLIGDKKTRNRRTELSLSEAITIVIMFHKTRYKI
jgi:hypothetical protein